MFKTVSMEKILAIIIAIIALIYIPTKILNLGYSPLDDANRHVAFSITDRQWNEIIAITPGLESDHNAGWHSFLRAIHKYFKLNKEELLSFSVIFLFLLFNLTGTLVSPNSVAWFVTLLIFFITQRVIFGRLMCGRPFLISCTAELILFKYWFDKESIKKTGSTKFSIFLQSFFVVTMSVWLHGTWYTFLLLPFALLISGKGAHAIGLTTVILLSTLAGAYLTGDFEGFLRFHYSSTFNIFTENIFNWQLVTEFHEGQLFNLCIYTMMLILFLLVKTKQLKLNELSKDPLFILILLCWLLSIKVARFWVDWGAIALAYWLSLKISILISLMNSVKKPVVRYSLFFFIILSTIILLPLAKWNERDNRRAHFADFNKPELVSFIPQKGGIIYNDLMSEFYFQYFENPNAEYKFILGFEPAIMPTEDRKVLRDITYTNYHFSAYKPWIAKLTTKDRIFTSVDISKNYQTLDWIKASSKLWIGKLKD